MPEVIAEEHRVFITNGGGSQLAFDEFYSQIKDWARFNIVGSPAEAEIIMELRFAVEDHGSHVHSAYNSYTKQTSVYTDELVDPQLTLDVYARRPRSCYGPM